jgi:hypothetical protein
MTCRECKGTSAFALCAECSAKHVRSTARLSTGHQGQYGYRLTKGFILMHFEDDEYVSLKERGVVYTRTAPTFQPPWPSRWWKDAKQ